jgi:hypothetical protein
MAEPDSLPALAADLAALSPRQRADLLKALSPYEAEQVGVLLGEAARPSVAALATPFSPWLLRHLVDPGEDRAGHAQSLTPATRTLLRRLAPEIEAAARIPEAPQVGRTSLLDALVQAVTGWRQAA